MVVTEVDDWSWWTSISGDAADLGQVADDVWDAALTTALDPSTELVSEDLIPAEITGELEDVVGDLSGDADDVAFASSAWSDDDHAHDTGDVLHFADEMHPVDGDQDGNDGFTELN